MHDAHWAASHTDCGTAESHTRHETCSRQLVVKTQLTWTSEKLHEFHCVCAHTRVGIEKGTRAPRLRTKTQAKHIVNLRQCIYNGRELNALLRLAKLNPVAIQIPALKQQWQPREKSLNRASDFSENRSDDKQHQNTNSDLKLPWRNARSRPSRTWIEQ